MTVWGCDLGVRSFTLAGLSPKGSLTLNGHACITPKKVAEQPAYMRALELSSLYYSIRGLVAIGDQVFVEEPPAAGAKNLRTFLKLAQVSAAVAIGAIQAGAMVTFVPVSLWKKEVIGNGGASKEFIATWLSRVYPMYFSQCARDQNRVDATCLALYGRGTDPRNFVKPEQWMAVS